MRSQKENAVVPLIVIGILALIFIFNQQTGHAIYASSSDLAVDTALYSISAVNEAGILNMDQQYDETEENLQKQDETTIPPQSQQMRAVCDRVINILPPNPQIPVSFFDPYITRSYDLRTHQPGAATYYMLHNGPHPNPPNPI